MYTVGTHYTGQDRYLLSQFYLYLGYHILSVYGLLHTIILSVFKY